MIVSLFEQIASKHKDKTAIITENQTLTYQELNVSANRIAHCILNRYKAPDLNPDEHAVILLFDYSPEMVIALWGTLKAGKIYVPLDSRYPETRLQYMLKNSGARMIITNRQSKSLAEKLAASVPYKISILLLEDINTDSPGTNPGLEERAHQIAYILYTSGSTGTPKGVVQECRNLVFYSQNYIQALSITPEDRMTFISSFSHDGAIQDIYGALLSGAALCPLDIKNSRTAAGIGAWLKKEKITLYHSVPTVLRYLTQFLDNEGPFPGIRLLITGGEPLLSSDIQAMQRLFPRASLAHMYGQTESSVNTVGFIAVDKKNGKTGKITIGEPLPGIELYHL